MRYVAFIDKVYHEVHETVQVIKATWSSIHHFVCTSEVYVTLEVANFFIFMVLTSFEIFPIRRKSKIDQIEMHILEAIRLRVLTNFWKLFSVIEKNIVEFQIIVNHIGIVDHLEQIE